jgi:hypothetical protein
MATVLAGSNDKEKLDDLITRTHKDQAVWFLNAFWEVPPAVTRPLPRSPLFSFPQTSFVRTSPIEN